MDERTQKRKIDIYHIIIQLDPYLVQRKCILRIYVFKLITTQSSSPYKVVLVSTSMVIVIVLLIQYVSL